VMYSILYRRMGNFANMTIFGIFAVGLIPWMKDERDEVCVVTEVSTFLIITQVSSEPL